jgi:fatty acid desaturase
MEPAVAVRRALTEEVRIRAGLTRWALAGNVVYLLATWAVALGGIAVFWTWPSWPTLVFAFVLVAARQQALLNIEHECVHGKFVRRKRWNEVVGVLTASAVGSPFYSARARHLAHHRLLATDDDPDAELHRGDDKATKLGLLRHFVLGVLGAYAFMVLVSKSSTSVNRAMWARDRWNLVWAQLGMLGLLWGLFAWWVYPVLWLAPVVTLTAGAHLLRNFCEHAVVEGEEAEHADRLISIRSNPVERFVVAPFFMNYHAEHHLFPWVPARRLPDVQRRLAARPDAPARLMRGSYLGALVRHVRALPRA